MENNTKNDPKYFYIVVLITFGLVALITWQVFFSNYEPFIDHKSNIENLPEVNFPFLDSFNFEGLSFFHRADDPLLSWEKSARSNPFDKPTPPEEQTLRSWWGVFNIKLNLNEEEIKGVYPKAVKEETNPELVLFESRIYNLIIQNPKNLECDFQVKDSEGDSLYSLEISQQENKLQFEALTDISNYSCGEKGGAIEVLESENNEEIVFEERFESELITLEDNLNRLYELTGDEEKYNTFQNDFNELKNQQENQDISSNLLSSEIKTLNQEITQEIETFNLENKEEILTDLNELEDIITDSEGETLVSEASEKINELFQEINLEENKEVNEYYNQLSKSIENVKEEYKNEEINNEELKEEFNKFYREIENIINDLD